MVTNPKNFIEPLFLPPIIFFLLAAVWVLGGRSFSQLNQGVKDAVVVSTSLVIRQFIVRCAFKPPSNLFKSF